MEEIDRTLEVNLRAPIAMAHALAPAMAARGEGHLLFVSSLSGKAATARTSLYNATKFGLRGFALGLRAELRDAGVGRLRRLPGLHPRSGDVRGLGREAPDAAWARAAPRTSPARSRRRSSATAREVDVAPLALRVGSAFAGLAPEPRRDRHPQDGQRQARRGDRGGPARQGLNARPVRAPLQTPSLALDGRCGPLRDGAQDGWR